MSPAAPRPETSCVRMSFISVLLVLEGRGDETLLLDGHTGHATRADLAAVGDELAQERGVLVVDVLDLRRLERVGLLLGLAHNGLCHRGALLLDESPGFGAPGWVLNYVGMPSGSLHRTTVLTCSSSIRKRDQKGGSS